MSMVMNKEAAYKVVERMPPDATWEDLIHELYVRATIESGLADLREGRTVDVSEVRGGGPGLS